MRDNIHTHIKVYNNCQKNKKKTLKYGKLPANEARSIPKERLLVDLILPYKILREGHDETLILKDLTMIDPETGCFEIIHYNDKQAATIENLVEQTWLCGYPRPKIITYDRGNEFLGQAFKNDPIEREYGIKSKCETIKNPQEKSILERIFQIIAELVCVFDLQKDYLDEDDP